MDTTTYGCEQGHWRLPVPMKISVIDNICLVFYCHQMAPTIHFAGNLFSMNGCIFNKAMGAPNDEVVPELVIVYKSPFFLATRKDGAAILTKKLHCNGVLPKDITFFVPCQVGA